MTLVYNDQSEDPGLHALVMGIGNYGGGLGSEATMLQAAVPSAHAIAKWLYEVYANADIPLRTLEVLLSPPANSAQAKGVDFGPSAGKPALQRHVESAVHGLPRDQGGVQAFGAAAAIRQWYNRCNKHRDNAAFVYLCGHGVEIRGDAHLLYEGFQTANLAQALADTLNLREFLGGMRWCQARKQLYFFDCCRDVPAWTNAFNNPGGSPIGDNTDLLLPGTLPLKATCVWAAMAGGRAGADRPDRSRFAEALLEVLRGPACKRQGARMVVSTSRISEAIRDLHNAGVVPPWGSQEPSLGPGDPFDFHVPTSPAVPVVITTTPPAANRQVQVGAAVCQPMSPGTWVAWCSLGPQQATLTENGAIVSSQALDVQPIFTPVSL